MIILGDRYQFSGIEKERLKREFNTIYYISYKNISTFKLIKKLEKIEVFKKS